MQIVGPKKTLFLDEISTGLVCTFTVSQPNACYVTYSCENSLDAPLH